MENLLLGLMLVSMGMGFCLIMMGIAVIYQKIMIKYYSAKLQRALENGDTAKVKYCIKMIEEFNEML